MGDGTELKKKKQWETRSWCFFFLPERKRKGMEDPKDSQGKANLGTPHWCQKTCKFCSSNLFAVKKYFGIKSWFR